MNLMTMQFGSFVFPVNPTELKFERACLLRETVGVDGEERVEAVGKRKARVAGKGHFTGENAMAVYRELEALFGETETLYLPGHRPFEAVLSELALIGVPEKNTVSYTFAFLSSGFEIFFEKSPKRIVVRKVNQATSASCRAIASLAIRAFTSSSCVCFAFSAGIALTTKIVPPILSTKPVFIFSTVITSLCKNRGVRFRTPRYQPKKDYSFS